MVNAFALNILYFTGAYVLSRYFLWQARVKGSLMQLGE